VRRREKIEDKKVRRLEGKRTELYKIEKERRLIGKKKRYQALS
jgi:hypothetical protein